jgi:hypothetical protein
VINSVFPPLGPISGNFSVSVFGGPFFDTMDLRCMFGSIQVQAIYKGTGEMYCFAPPHPPGIYPLEIAVNAQDYTTLRTSFFYYADQALSRIYPVAGPALAADTYVQVYGSGFVNSTLLSCRFGGTVSFGVFVTSNHIICYTPALDGVFKNGSDGLSGGMRYLALSEQFSRVEDPLYYPLKLPTGPGRRLMERPTVRSDNRLFPGSHYYPLYLCRLTVLEVSNNNQDYTNSGITFLYQADANIIKISPTSGQGDVRSPIVVYGSHFVNSTLLRCRVGREVSFPTYLSSTLILCFSSRTSLTQMDTGYVRDRTLTSINTPGRQTVQTSPPGAGPNVVYVEVANNGQDYTNNQLTFTFNIKCKSGYYCPDLSYLPCPRGTFCPGEFNGNFTLCPKGTYNPRLVQSDCLRCPIGFMCPDEGMQVPRICPSGKVCEFTGIINADNPCPQGHFCLEGTATSATSCGHPQQSSELFPTLSHAESPSTIRHNRIAEGHELYLGARNTGCWINQTNDFGLQVSDDPALFWMERHLLPLALDAPFNPSRGRYCLDDKCMAFEDAMDLKATDYAFDYTMSTFALRRPVPCAEGQYCHPGTGVNSLTMKNFTTPQPCMETMYCPEGSFEPTGAGECPQGFYCPFGARLACPVGTYCPREGTYDPLPCPPGTFNSQIGMSKCTECPRGYICPGFGRVAPAICPPGYACSRNGLRTPNHRCIAGYYCSNGTETIDPFRNDTTLRPYPCSPGTYCVTGAGYNTVIRGDFLYAQICTEGFYCEAGSRSATGSGLCPPGFICPVGTSVPQPTPKGSYAELSGTIVAASCLPGTYAPTIETTICYPCPPGTSCTNEGTLIPVRTYR